MPIGVRKEMLSCIGLITVIALGLYFSSLYSYLLFHGLIEITTITIGFTLFILSWNSRRFLANDCLKFIGIGYAFIAVIDLLHTLAYKGMSVFPGYGANLPTQLWIAARFLQAVTLCTAPAFARRRISEYALFGAYFAVVSTIVASVYSGNFPDCYVEGKGLTPFKIISEYVISAMLLFSLILFRTVRTSFKDSVFSLLIASIICTVVSEISFTAYLSVYGFANMVGHFLKLAAFYLVYRALLVTGLKEPFDLIFRDLKQTEESLRKAHATLEDTVRERTAELRASEEKYRGLVQKIQVAVVVHGPDTRIRTNNLLAQRLLGLTERQMTGKSVIDPDWRFFRDDGTAMPPDEYPVNRVLTTKRPIRNTVAGVHRPGAAGDVWVLVSADPVLDEQGGLSEVIVTFIDITERKQAEDKLRRLNRELRAIGSCNQALVRAEDEQKLLDEICRIICDEAGYRMVWVGYAEHDEAKSIRPAAWAGVEEGYLAEARLTWADTERGRGPSGISIRSGMSFCIQDFASDPHAAPWRENALRRGYRSSISLPLKNEKSETFGTLAIYSTEPNAFTADEIRLLEELAADLAFGISVLRARDARKEAERRIALLSFALDNMREAAYLVDEQARFHYVNEESCRALKYTREELLGLGVTDIDPAFPSGRWPGHWEELKMRGSLTFEGLHKAKGGRIFPVEINANYVEYEGREYSLALVRDITERKRVEDALRFIAQRGWAGTADTFLIALAGYLGNTLGMDYVFIAKLADDEYGMAETVALYAKGEILANMRYGLKGTPCENVIGKKLCLYPEGVQALFPYDTLLADMGAESYAGIPLWDSTGRSIGLLAALDGRPLHDAVMLSYILQLAAASAAAALERGRDERLLKARELEFRTLAENSPDCILRYDNGARCIYANPRIENILGIPAGGMPGKTPTEMFPAGEYREYQHRIEEVLGSGADADLEVLLPDTCRGVRYHHVRFTAERDQQGVITGVLVIGRDITERKRAEEEIRRLKNYLSNIIDSMPSILVGVDRDETVIQWNRQAEEISGISATEAVGRPITELLPDFSPWIEAMRSEVDRQRPASMEKLLIEKQGERRFYDLMFYPLISNGVEGAVVRIEDATERARIQELIIQTEKMLSVGGLAAGMAHEINNPLGIIIQAAQNMERRVSPELQANREAAEVLGVSLEGINAYFEKRQIGEFIRSIREASFRASRIIANMLQFSRRAGSTMQPASPAEIIEQALELAAGDYDLKQKFDFRSIEIIRDYAPDMPEVSMVVIEMEQVMLNLLKNAAQALTLNPPGLTPRITLRLRREERYALVEVEDNGPGMPEDVRRRVFEPFFTTKEPGVGTGLGLSVSYMIVTQNHKGLMEVESNPGKGACFRVRLPLSS